MCVSEIANYRHLLMRDNMNGKSSNNGQKCRKPVFMGVSGNCFIKWFYFDAICEWSNRISYTRRKVLL